jgi:DNA-binding GntR family transcriptional regulator
MPAERSLADKVYDKVKERIIDQTYPAGMALTELGLAAEFGVSKTPVKSAIVRLLNENWLESGFRKKVYVKDITEEQIKDYYELRILLENAAIEKIFNDEKNWDFSFELETALVKMKASVNEHLSFEKADANFHSTLMRIFQNEKIMDIYSDLNDELLRVSMMVRGHSINKERNYYETIISEFESFILAVRNGDKKSAVNYLIDIHIMRSYHEALESIRQTE